MNLAPDANKKGYEETIQKMKNKKNMELNDGIFFIKRLSNGSLFIELYFYMK